VTFHRLEAGGELKVFLFQDFVFKRFIDELRVVAGHADEHEQDENPGPRNYFNHVAGCGDFPCFPAIFSDDDESEFLFHYALLKPYPISYTAYLYTFLSPTNLISAVVPS
jgi:hypothetical protein